MAKVTPFPPFRRPLWPARFVSFCQSDVCEVVRNAALSCSEAVSRWRLRCVQTFIKLLTVDLSARASMKNAANCDI